MISRHSTRDVRIAKPTTLTVDFPCMRSIETSVCQGPRPVSSQRNSNRKATVLPGVGTS